MRRGITLFDTSISTRNVGDEIIMDAVNNVVFDIFKSRQIFRVPTHNYLTLGSYKCLRESFVGVVGGSNLLSSNMPFYQQWNILPQDIFFLRNVVLLGVGWWQYQRNPNWYTKLFLNKALSSELTHSVRDNYTLQRLSDIGIKNVVNTGCPTMWGLTREHCNLVPETKAREVIYTLTDYNRASRDDSETLKILKKNYETVYIWLQGSKDYEYLKSIGGDKIVDVIIPPQLRAYDDILQSKDVEYVGTRLHAGIRAIQKKRRSLVLAVDNRALEKQKDYNIHVLERSQVSEIESKILERRRTDLAVDFRKIDAWKRQFASMPEMLV